MQLTWLGFFYLKTTNYCLKQSHHVPNDIVRLNPAQPKPKENLPFQMFRRQILQAVSISNIRLINMFLQFEQ